VYVTKYVNERRYRSLYISVWLKLSTGWEAPPTDAAPLFNLGIDNDQRVVIALSGQSPLRPVLVLGGAPDKRRLLPPTLADASVATGEWQRWEIYAVKNTPGRADGIVVWWINGTKVLDYRDLALGKRRERDQFDHFQWQPSWGKYNDKLPVAMSVWVDHVFGAGTVVRGTGPVEAAPPPPAPVARVEVRPNPVSLITGDSMPLTVAALDSSGTAVSSANVTWASTDSSVASISALGMLTARKAGAANVTAAVGGVAGSTAVTVADRPPTPVASVTVSLSQPSIVEGSGTQATAVLQDANGNALTNRSIVWSSSDTTIARVLATGAVTGVKAGTANIVGTSEGKSGSASLTVTAAPPAPVATVTVTLNSPSLTTGQSTQAVASMKDVNGNVLTGRAVTWGSSNPAAATVSSTGLVAAVAAGSAQITATSEGKSGSATITITAAAPAPVATVTVALGTASIAAGQTTPAVATLKDASGATLSGRAVSWSSNNTAAATVSSTGLVSAVAVGSAQITATSEGQSGSATVTVTAATPPPPPPPPGTCGAADIASWGFDDGTWGPYQPVDGRWEAIVADPTAIGGHSMRTIYVTTTGNGMSSGVTKRFDALASQKLYVRWAYKQDATFDNSGIKKYLRFQGPGYTGLFGTLINNHNRFNWVWDGDSGDTYENVGTEITPNQLRGAWHWYEVMNDITQSGALHVRFWIDGQLKIDFTRPISNRGFQFGTVDVAGVFNAPSANGTDWIDEVSISRACIDLQ
jgi:uncharacterized protein YjdB